MGEEQHKISAFADGMLFSLTNPVVSLPNLIREFETYGQLSNLRINLNKSEAMGVGVPIEKLQTLQTNLYIPSNLSRIFKLNFPPID